ncbi:MAG: acylphosphatase, partial [Selenomonadaceae bacterium]|nr:acylphosphatase [Selenomonadaceae bacterium]
MSYLNIKIYGIVQGVGFRPFVSRLADECGILGTVCNKGPYVEIFAQGTPVALENFIHGLHHRAPERSTILKIDVTELHEDAAFSRFDIVESAKEQGDIFVSPDIATCEKCRKELFDPEN